MKQEGRISSEDYFCPAGSSEWVRAKDDPVLGGLFMPPRPSAGPSLSGPIDARRGTVVQVTNVIHQPQVQAYDEGPAAPKSPGLALFLSFLLCGMGQIYNGQIGKGIAFLIGCILAWVFFLGWIFWIWSMADAYSNAKKMSLRYQRRMLAGIPAAA